MNAAALEQTQQNIADSQNSMPVVSNWSAVPFSLGGNLTESDVILHLNSQTYQNYSHVFSWSKFISNMRLKTIVEKQKPKLQSFSLPELNLPDSPLFDSIRGTSYAVGIQVKTFLGTKTLLLRNAYGSLVTPSDLIKGGNEAVRGKLMEELPKDGALVNVTGIGTPVYMAVRTQLPVSKDAKVRCALV